MQNKLEIKISNGRNLNRQFEDMHHNYLMIPIFIHLHICLIFTKYVLLHL